MSESQRFQFTGGAGINEDVSSRHQATKSFLSVLGVEIRHDRALIGIEIQVAEAVLGTRRIVQERRLGAKAATTGWLHHDHLSAEVCQDSSRQCRRTVAEFDDTNACECLAHGSGIATVPVMAMLSFSSTASSSQTTRSVVTSRTRTCGVMVVSA